jgi:hypothetical protein
LELRNTKMAKRAEKKNQQMSGSLALFFRRAVLHIGGGEHLEMGDDRVISPHTTSTFTDAQVISPEALEESEVDHWKRANPYTLSMGGMLDQVEAGEEVEEAEDGEDEACTYGCISHGRNTLEKVYEEKKAKYEELARELRTRRQEEVRVTAVIVSSMGALYGPSMKDLQKV